METDPTRVEPSDADLAEREAAAAAAEAGAIGGPTPDEDLDPAERAVREAGGGEGEGFEMAEDQLIERASHGDPAPDPLEDEFGTTEDARQTSTYAEPDEQRSSQVVADPDAGPDDPGRGPGMTHER